MRERFEGLVDGAFEVSRREARWLAIGDTVVAFAADDDAGWQRLVAEAWLFAKWRSAGVPVPRIVAEVGERRVLVLERLHGLTGDHIERALGGTTLSPFGRRLAEWYGELAARMHRAVPIHDAKIGLSRRRALNLDVAIARLRASSASDAAKAAATRSRAWLAKLPPPNVVIHGDLHFFNMFAAPDGTITGVLDVDEAGLDDAAGEFLYVHSLGAEFVERAIAAYGTVDMEAVRRAHLRTALDHLIWFGPGTERHPKIVAWVTDALEKLAP